MEPEEGERLANEINAENLTLEVICFLERLFVGLTFTRINNLVSV